LINKTLLTIKNQITIQKKSKNIPCRGVIKLPRLSNLFLKIWANKNQVWGKNAHLPLDP
jgi:hypothetical protein